MQSVRLYRPKVEWFRFIRYRVKRMERGTRAVPKQISTAPSAAIATCVSYHRLKPAKKRLRHNVLAIALARIAYSIRWNGSRKFCLT